MNWLLFTHPALLGGLAALAIPILIHLLLKTRRRRLRFSTLLFFRRPNEEARRRRKLRHWLLLAARLLMVALLVLGFARPYRANRTGDQAGQPRRQVILVVDRSASMSAVDREGQRWERAKTAIRKVVSGLRRDERAALVSCSTRAEVVLGPALPDDILKTIEDLQPTQGKTELGEGLQLAGKVVANSGSGYTNTIYVASDLQRNGCRNLGSYPIPREVDLKVLNFGDLFTPNVALTELNLEVRGTAKPYAALANFSDEDTAPFNMQFRIDGKEEQAGPLQLRGGSSTNIELRVPHLPAGWHSAEVRIQPKDALALDDVRYQTIFVPPLVSVLVVEPRPAAKVYLEESFFIISALDPAFGTTNQSHSGFQVEKATPELLAAKLRLREGAPQVLVLPALKQIPSDLGQSLERHVRAGGGLLMFLGDTVSANRYGSELGGVLPAQLGAVESANEFDWHLWEKDTKLAMFAPFRQPNSGNLALAKFTRRFALKGYDEAAVMARFQDGVPLMIGRNLGQGKVLLVNSSADTAWTDWPKHRTYVPWVHAAVRYLGGGHRETNLRADAALLAGTETDLNVGPALKKASITIHRPDGQVVMGTTDETGTLRDVALATSGIYSFRGADGQEIQRLAVNLPSAESDLVAMGPAEFAQQVARIETNSSQSLAASLFGTAPDHRELWRLCLLGVFGLLFIELLLANRTVA